MTEKKIFNFTVPVSGEESFSVVASSYEEALEKINEGKYYDKPIVNDIEWDFGFRDPNDELPSCYTLSVYKDESND